MPVRIQYAGCGGISSLEIEGRRCFMLKLDEHDAALVAENTDWHHAGGKSLPRTELCSFRRERKERPRDRLETKKPSPAALAEK